MSQYCFIKMGRLLQAATLIQERAKKGDLTYFRVSLRFNEMTPIFP